MKRRHRAKPEPANLVPYLHLLSKEEKAIICHIVNAAKTYTVTGEEIITTQDLHLGTMPFLSRAAAVGALRFVIPSGPHERIFKQILSKLEGQVEGRSYARFTLALNDVKVYRRFGAHPERGIPVSWLPKEKVTAGVAWSLPHKEYRPKKDVLVSSVVTLKRLGKRQWQVEVLSKHQYAAEQWLLSNCQ